MKSSAWAWFGCLLWMGSVAACGSTVETSDTDPPEEEVEVNPEAICSEWVAQSCQSIAGCCGGGDKFDMGSCELSLSYTCSNALPPELIRAGVLDFDEDAARECYKPLVGCLASEPDEQQLDACRRMLKGHRPLGSACDISAQCEPSKEGYSACYFTDFVGLCVQVVTSADQTCGFSLTDHTLRECPKGTFCDTQNKTVPPDASPSEAAYVFSAPCKPLLGAGAPCYDAENGVLLDCAAGLYCDFYEAETPEDVKCAQAKPGGADCYESYQCAAGLECSYDTSTCVQKSGQFCYGPAVCGNSICEAQETEQSCPADCGYCGDGYCGFEEEEYCWEDCGETGYCGDGYCDVDEDEYGCIEDCGYCGDGYCSFYEDEYSCAEDCGYCGDGYCGVDEDPASCAYDCGYCGDGYCGPNETQDSCAEDCGGACLTCSEFITSGEGTLCDGPSVELYDALVICVCDGPCAAVCGDNICAGASPNAECQSCVLDEAAGCGGEYAACANDF